MDSRYTSDSDDEGGVKLGNCGQSADVKPTKKDLDGPSGHTAGNGKLREQAKVANKKRKKEEDPDEASNPYLASQYEGPPRKKEMDPRMNPYLAHKYEEPAEDEDSYNGYNNGYIRPTHRMNGLSHASSLSRFPRHKSTAAMAKDAEDGPNNPFSGQPLSSQYFNILKTRRNLPVHQQRYAQKAPVLEGKILTPSAGTNSCKCIRNPNFLCS